MTPERIRQIKFYWAATIAFGLTALFVVDLIIFFGVSEEVTLSATLRTVLELDDVKSVYVPIFGFLCGVWFSHFFQFSGKAGK